MPSFPRRGPVALPLPPDARPGHEAIGRELFDYLVDLGGLGRHDAVLEVGCGNGLLAARVAEHLEPPGRYDGFDVAEASIAWCQAHITPAYPHVRFRAVPAGSDAFPYADSSVDVVVAAFTRALAPELERHAAEIARVLAPGGRLFATCFLVTDDAERRLEAGTAKEPLVHRHDAVTFVADPDRPAAAVAYREEHALGILERAGLEVATVAHGAWSGRDDFLGYEDVVVARAPEAAGPT